MACLKFTKSHEWVRVEEGLVTIGISEYAQRQLGDVVFVELPSKGAKVSKGSQIGTIESTKTASEVYTPLSGEVVEVNEDLVNNPQWVNESPLEKGWMIKLKAEDSSELDELMEESQYKAFVEEESH
ncbi:MAG: glycine cleavage system protein GcvH [Candidatus Omnitrophica bacterium]|nr:glycine cleavage system protein GcvH [Candidatus Omnitrophota bacterium]MBD3269277.1 glycine cleavage system protein GcvH [Candidatus Omnitrophota bacterium]